MAKLNSVFRGQVRSYCGAKGMFEVAFLQFKILLRSILERREKKDTYVPF